MARRKTARLPGEPKRGVAFWDAKWSQLVSEQAGSGLTQVKFCERHGVSVHSFRKWKYGHRGSLGKPTLRFVELRIDREEEIPAAASPVQAGVEVHLESGHRVRVAVDFDARSFRRVVEALERPRC